MEFLYQGAEKYINDIFWNETHDKDCSIDAAAEIKNKLIEDEKIKDPEYYNSQSGVFHVSELGGKCLRGAMLKQFGAKPDNEPDGRRLGVFRAGNLFEDFITDALSSHIITKQREYVFNFKNISIRGRSDFLLKDGSKIRVGENKSVHSDSFWAREKEGVLQQWNNQIQLQTYMWLERMLYGNEYDGLFTYVSKDDCTVISVPVKFNINIINNIVIPTLELLNEAYSTRNPLICPVPDPVIFNTVYSQWRSNWIAKYCDYHNQCAGENWLIEAMKEVKKRNIEYKESRKRKKEVLTSKDNQSTL